MEEFNLIIQLETKKNKQQIYCPICHEEHDLLISKAKRQRRKCSKCGVKRELKYWIKELPNQTKTQIIRSLPIEKSRYNLSYFDTALIYLLCDKKLPGYKIAQKCKKNKSTISRHIKTLKKLNFITDIGGKPKLYDLNTSRDIYNILKEPKTTIEIKEKATEEKINAVSLHKGQVKCAILEKGNLNPTITKQNNKLTGWTKKYFKENNLKFELSDRSIIFWPQGVGKTSNEAINNCKEKTHKIKEFLEIKYNCKLGFPDFKWESGNQKIHYVPIRTTKEKIQELQEVWTDNTPKGCIETEGREFVDQVINVNQDVQIMKERLENNTINREMINEIIHQAISQNLTQFKIEITKDMAKEVGSAVSNALKELFLKKSEGTSDIYS